MVPEKDLHPGCIQCRKTNVAKSDIIDEDSGKVLVRKGDFAIKCKGIPKNPEDYLVQITDKAIVKALGEDMVRQYARMEDPVLWAYDNLRTQDLETKLTGPWTPQGATKENIEAYNLDPSAAYYQELMVKCTARRSLFRIGRRCLPAGERVAMADGTFKSIEDIKVGDYVIANNLSKGTQVQKKVTDTFINGVRQIYKIKLNDGSSIRCTANHPLLRSITAKRGFGGQLEWASIEDGLSVGDKVRVARSINKPKIDLLDKESSVSETLEEAEAKYWRLAKIVSIEPDGKEQTYDITVDKWHNFLVDGIVTHNSGKTWTLIVKMLHKMFTNENYRVLIITPAINQLDLIFDQAMMLIRTSPTLDSSGIRFVKSPSRTIQLPNGSQAKGFVSGNETIRGQAGDMIIIDEGDYLNAKDLSGIIAILSEHSSTVFFVASTPSGAREQFWKWDQDPEFRSFHFPSMCRPGWTEDMEIEQRKELRGHRYVHEILADYGELNQGVFQHNHINGALSEGDYEYEAMSPEPGWIYTMGVDWNPVNGTECYVVGVDISLPESSKRYKVVDKAVVFRGGNRQIDACNEIIRLNRKWEPAAIFVDRGAGDMQVEFLEKAGREAPPNTPDKKLATIIRAIDFGSKIEMRHPGTGREIKEYAKPAVVENAVRFFEENEIQLSNYDKDLERQLRGYMIEKIGQNNRPVYGMFSDEVSDHALDAFMLALFAFTMKFSKLGNPIVTTKVENVPRPEAIAFSNVPKEKLPPSREIKEGQVKVDIPDERDKGYRSIKEVRKYLGLPARSGADRLIPRKQLAPKGRTPIQRSNISTTNRGKRWL